MFLRSALVLAVLCFPGAVVCAATESDGKRPNILFLAVDDLRPEIDSYGARQMVTPHFDRLAGRGVQFDRAYCNIAVCGASRASLMKGLRPTPSRFTKYYTRADEDAPQVPSLPMVFKQHGYHTQSNGKVYHHVTDDPQAWSEPSWAPETPSIWWALPENRALATGKDRGPAYEAADAPDDIYPDHQICDKTLDDLRRLAGQNQPFFLACGFYRPHLPFSVPKKYWDLYPPDQIELPDNMFFPRNLLAAFQYDWGELRAYHGIPKKGPVSEETAQTLIRGYYASVSFVDAQLGRLLDALEELGVADNTVIVLWGDHGFQLGEHGFWCKHTNFEIASRTPLIVDSGYELSRFSGMAGVADPQVGVPAQLYSLSAVAYESLMLGMFQIHLGPDNKIFLKASPRRSRNSSSATAATAFTGIGPIVGHSSPQPAKKATGTAPMCTPRPACAWYSMTSSSFRTATTPVLHPAANGGCIPVAVFVGQSVGCLKAHHLRYDEATV